MSKILNRYKAYLKLLEKLDVALNSLDVIEAENIIFIKTEKATYEENIIAQLELAGIEAELEGTKKALGSIKSMLEKPDLAEDVQKKLSGYLQKKENDIRQLTEKIEQYRKNCLGSMEGLC